MKSMRRAAIVVMVLLVFAGACAKKKPAPVTQPVPPPAVSTPSPSSASPAPTPQRVEEWLEAAAHQAAQDRTVDLHLHGHDDGAGEIEEFLAVSPPPRLGAATAGNLNRI